MTRGHNIVADGWAGAEILGFPHFDWCSPTDQRTDGRKKPLVESLVHNLKISDEEAEKEVCKKEVSGQQNR